MERVQSLDNDMRWTELSLVLMDDPGIAALHERYLGDHRPTDVISFAYPPSPGAAEGHTGEVVVNVERAVREGPRHDGTERELALYIAHGCHHLTGADDHTPTLRARMRRVETQWLQEAETEGVLAGLSVKPH